MCKNPCYQCPDRWIKEDDNGKARTCHGTCKLYAEFQDYNEKKRQENNKIGDVNGYIHQSAERVKKKTGWYSNKDRR